MYGEMLTHTEGSANFGRATDTASSFNTAACCFAECDPGTASHCAASPHTAADSDRFAAPNASATPLAHNKLE
jgi:hypothetical protein